MAFNDMKNVCIQNGRAGVLIALILSAGWASGQENVTAATDAPTAMPESVRVSIESVVVSPGLSPLQREVTGTYGKTTPGLVEGAMDGSDIGRGPSKDVGPISLGIPIPILTIPGAIFGGLSGMTQEAIQEFRDTLTEDLAKSASQPLNNSALASTVFSSVRQVNGLDAKMAAQTQPVPQGSDVVLYVGLTGVEIDVQGSDAIITTKALATLRRISDGIDLYEREAQYQDRDTLRNWTADKNALWRQYATYARHFLGRELAAEVFDRVDLPVELRPAETKTVSRVKRNDWQGVSRSSTPTLAWAFELLEDASSGELMGKIDSASVTWDLEIYDLNRLVYSARQLPDQSHRVEIELPGCQTYRWSVRPSYRFGTSNRFGDWMRSGGADSSGNIGRQASVSPAYTQDFASLEIKCGRR
jgi:hypothetical protein